MSIRNLMGAAAMLCSFLPIVAPPARAVEVAELEMLSRATDAVDPGMSLAQEQASRGELLGAVTTLERLLINHPEAIQAQLLHASLLCRLDDRSGASVEFDALRRRDFEDPVWTDAIAPCADKAGGG